LIRERKLEEEELYNAKEKPLWGMFGNLGRGGRRGGRKE